MNVTFTLACKRLLTFLGVDMHMLQRYVQPSVTILHGNVGLATSHGLMPVMELLLGIPRLLLLLLHI
jgi:hypothetical protein